MVLRILKRLAAFATRIRCKGRSNGRSNGLDTISEPFDFRLMPGATAVGSQEDCTFKRTTPSTVPRCNRSPISACSPGIDMLSS